MKHTLLLLLIALLTKAQSTFEVASIKEIEHAEFSKTDYGPANLHANGVTVKQLIEWAYDVTSLQVSGGPSWITEKQFEVDAKAEGAHTYKELRAMLQPLLAERFHLGIRRERRELPVYALTVAKGGVKLRSAQGGRPSGILLQSSVDPAMVRVVGQSVSMRYLASFLTGTLSSLVEDETGLDKSYDFAIDVPFSGALGKLEANAAAVTEALSRLGFELHSRKRSVELIVVDGISALTPN